MQRRSPSAAAGVVLVAIGITAVTPATAPYVPDILLTAGNEDIVIDFVRHGETNPPGSQIAVASNGLPGYPLSNTGPLADNGVLQAQHAGDNLAGQFGTPTGTLADGTTVPVGGVEGIFGGYEQRMSETAAPFLTNEGFSTTPDPPYGVISPGFTPLNGFDEIGGGIYVHAPPSSLGDILYELTVLAWAFGFRFVPLPGSNDFNGMQFEENFGQAVNTAYLDATTDPNPVISANGQLTDVVFSGEAAISTWTLMNVNNPDIAIFLPLFINSLFSGDSQPFLPTTGQVVVEGNPVDGWTLVSFNGTPIPADPGLLTELIVDLRNVITAPQMAAWDLVEAVLTGDQTLGSALQNGLGEIGAALVQFPGAVIGDIVSEGQNLFADLAAGEALSAAFGSAILGLA